MHWSNLCSTQHHGSIPRMEHTTFHKLYWFSEEVRQRTWWKSVEDPSNIRHGTRDHQPYQDVLQQLRMQCHLWKYHYRNFPIKSGVRQGCILSPILFLITIDWVMRQTTAIRSRGTQWTLFSHLLRRRSWFRWWNCHAFFYPPSGGFRRPQYERKDNRSEHQKKLQNHARQRCDSAN